MSSRQDFSKQLPKYDDSKSFSDYEETVFQILMTESTYAYDHIKTGIQPSFLIPAIDLYVAIAIRTFPVNMSSSATKKPASSAHGTATPPAAIQPPDLPNNLPAHWIFIPQPTNALPSWSSLHDIMDADYKDKRYYYQLQRNPAYYGQQGYDIWKDEKSCVIRAKYLFENQERQKIWSLLFNCIPSNYQDKIVILAEYNNSLKLFDYVWLWCNIKFAITGEGPQSVPLLITKLMSTKMVNNDFSSFARNYTQLIDDIRSRKLTGDQLVTLLFDTIFYSGLVGPTNTILRPQVDRIFEDNIWPPAVDSITKFSKLLTTREKVETAYAGEGVIKANLAKTNAKKNAYSKPQSSGSNSMCWNCGRIGHICTNCKAPVSTCNTCAGSHHTLAHDHVKTAEARALSRGKTFSSPNGLSNKFKHIPANMVDQATYDDSHDDEQYESMQLSLSANLISFNEEDDGVPTDARADDDCDDEPQESMYGFNAFIIRGVDATSETTDSSTDSLPDLIDDSDDDVDDEVLPLHLINGNFLETFDYHSEAADSDDGDTSDDDTLPELVDHPMYPTINENHSEAVDLSDNNTQVPEMIDLPIENTFVHVSDIEDEYVKIELDEEMAVATSSTPSNFVLVASASMIEIQQRRDDSSKVLLNHNSWSIATIIPANLAVNIHAGPTDIIAYLDSAAGGHIFLPDDRTNPMFTHVTASRGIVIEGVDEKSEPIPVVYTAKHHILGHCHFAQIRNRLIGIPKLLKKDFSMTGKRGNIIIHDKDNNEVFNSVPDERGLYPVNLSSIFSKLQPVKSTIQAFDGTLVHAPPVIDSPMSHLEIQRARQCRDLHIANGHPSNSTLTEALDNGAWPMIDLTSRDLVNSNKLLGVCAGCTEGKMVNPSEPSTNELRAHAKGELLYMDLLKPVVRCIGGHTQALVSRDYVTSYITTNGMPDKSTNNIVQTIISIIAFYLSYGHTVKVVVFDHEATFVAVEHKIPGVRVQFTPTGMKNKHVERAIREIKEKDRCTRANLPYELPAELEIECWIAQAESINLLPNSASGPNHTPFQLVTNTRPILRPYPFGVAVLAYARKYNDPESRAEWGLFLGQPFPGNSRVYLPLYKVIVSRRKVMPQTSYPNDWKFIRRPKLITPTASPSVLDVPQPVAEQIDTSVNPLVVHNPLPVNNYNAPSPVSTQSPTINNDGIQSQAAREAPTFPSIAQFIPTTVPRSEISLTPETAVPVPPLQPPIVNTVISEPERRYNFRENRKPPERYEANYSLPTNVKPYQVSYGKSNVGVPVKNSVPCQHVNLDHVKARIIACRISMRQALKDPDPQRATAAKSALVEELSQLIESGTFDPKLFNSLNQEQRRRVIPSHMFFKDKFFADGRFQKLKARLVAGGNFVDTSLIGDISSWTVNPITVMMMLNMTALAQLKILTIDVKGAFLIPDLSDSPSDLTYVTIDKLLSDEIVKLKPSWSRLRNPSGTFTMQLKKTLYGLGISSNRWMTHLNTTLFKLGFMVSPGDRCCFMRGTGNTKLIICSHVDDILCIGHLEGLTTFKSEFEKVYEINAQEGYKHSYIGLDIIQEPSTYKVSIGQTGYRRDILNRFAHLLNNSRNDGKVPCGMDIVEPDPPECDPVERSTYMSIIMSIMFLARFTRPDLSFAVGMLSTHCTNPNDHHMTQAIKLLKYIANSPDMAIVFTVTQPMPTIFADASHATHHDGRGHGCLIIKLGSGFIYCRSYKLKLITLSSTESEHVVLCDATTLSEWLLSMLNFIGITTQYIRVRQDNTSTIWLSENEGNFARNKHLLIRRNKAKEGVLSGIIKIIYIPTEAMAADLGTKPLTLRQLLIHMNNIGMMVVTRPNGLYTLNRIVIPTSRPVQRPDKRQSVAPTDSVPNRGVRPVNKQADRANYRR